MKKVVEKLKALTEKRQKFIDQTLSDLDGSLKEATLKLYDGLINSLQRKLTFEGETVKATAANYKILDDVDKYMDKFSETVLNPIVKDYGLAMLKTVRLSSDMYIAQGFAEKTLEGYLKNWNFLEQSLGLVSKNGSLFVKEGAFIDRLANSADVRDQIKNVLMNDLTAKSSWETMQKNFTELINPEEVDGTLTKYWKRYAWDALTRTQAAADNYLAESLELKHFVYQGDLINTSREWCVEKVGLVFHRDILEQWETEEWKGKAAGIPVVLARGGYNCRHEFNWISEELAEYLLSEQGVKIEKEEVEFNGKVYTPETINQFDNNTIDPVLERRIAMWAGSSDNIREAEGKGHDAYNIFRMAARSGDLSKSVITSEEGVGGVLKTLYRGEAITNEMYANELLTLYSKNVGNVIAVPEKIAGYDLSMASFTSKKEVCRKFNFLGMNDGTRVMYEVEGNIKGFDIRSSNAAMASEREIISSLAGKKVNVISVSEFSYPYETSVVKHIKLKVL